MSANEFWGRVLSAIAFVSALLFCATLPEADSQAREFWWCLSSIVIFILAGIGLGWLIKKDNHW